MFAEELAQRAKSAQHTPHPTLLCGYPKIWPSAIHSCMGTRTGEWIASEVPDKPPPRSVLWVWVTQRVGCDATNHDLYSIADKIPKTLLKQWHVNSTFQLILNNQDSATNRAQMVPKFNQSGMIKLDATLLTKWKRAIAGRAGSRGKLGNNQPDLNKIVKTTKGIDINGKRFSPCNQHKGNSQVEIVLGKDQRFGEIDMIFLSPQKPGKTWIVIKPYKEVKNTEDPYRQHPDLNCRLVQTDCEAVVIIDSRDVIGHAATLKHQKGTFGIERETMSAVGLGTSVSNTYLLIGSCMYGANMDIWTDLCRVGRVCEKHQQKTLAQMR